MTTEQRLERLERQNRRLRCGMIVMVVAGLSLLVMGQTLPPKVHDVVRAKKFKVIGDNDQVVVDIHSWVAGGQIFVNDKKGNLAVGITSFRAGSIVVYNKKEKGIVLIGANDGGGGMVLVNNANGKEVATISQTKEKDGTFTTYDSKGTRLISIGASTDGEARIMQYNRADKIKTYWPRK